MAKTSVSPIASMIGICKKTRPKLYPIKILHQFSAANDKIAFVGHLAASWVDGSERMPGTWRVGD